MIGQDMPIIPVKRKENGSGRKVISDQEADLSPHSAPPLDEMAQPVPGAEPRAIRAGGDNPRWLLTLLRPCLEAGPMVQGQSAAGQQARVGLGGVRLHKLEIAIT